MLASTEAIAHQNSAWTHRAIAGNLCLGDMMRRRLLLPCAVLALATNCADQQMTAPLRAPVGRPSFALTPTADRTFAYVANDASDNVSVIRTSDNSVVATIAVGDAPRGVAFTPSGGRVYVTNFSSDNVSVIRTSDNTVIATIPVGDQPVDVAAAPDGARMYVLNREDGTISVIRTSDNTVVATIPVAEEATGMAITPNGSELYVIGHVTYEAGPPFGTITINGLSVIRTSDYTVRDTDDWPFGSNPVDVAITPDGSRAYLPTSSAFPPNGSLRVIQTSDLTSVTSLTLPGLFSPHGVGITPNGGEAYVLKPGASFFGGACSPGGVWIIPTAANTIAATVDVTTGCFPSEVAFTPDGARAYVTTIAQGQASGSVNIISTSTRAVIGSVTVGIAPNGLAIAFVPTPSQLLGGLQDAVSTLALPSGIESSLLTKLSSALTAIQAGKTHGACGALQDFVSQVTALSGKKISAADATLLIQAANQTRDLIGC